MFSATVAAMSLADLVTIALIASSTSMVWPARSPSLEGAMDWEWALTRSSRIEAEAALLELLEE